MMPWTERWSKVGEVVSTAPTARRAGRVIRKLRAAKWGLIGWPQFLQPLEIIAEQDANSERHFVNDCRSIAVAAFAKLASCVMSDPEFLAPESNGPSAHIECCRDVFLKNAVGFQSAEKL